MALGPDGLIDGMRAGTALFSRTTNAPAWVRRLHGLFAARGVQVLDAPVSGGPVGAKTRRLAIWVVSEGFVAVGVVGDGPGHVGRSAGGEAGTPRASGSPGR